MIELDAFLAPLVGKGHSMYAIITNNPNEVKVSISTLYNYRSKGYLRLGGYLPPRVIRFKTRRKRKERIDRVNYGYEAYLKYMKLNPDASVVEMDVLEGRKGGKVLLTLTVKKANFLLAFLLDKKNQDEVKYEIDRLENALGIRRFRRLFDVTLTDNGSKFINPDKISLNKQGKLRTKIFYCDPNSPQQKGTIENAHSLVRRVIPKGVSIDHLTQEDVDIMINNLNSYTRKSLNGKSPYQIMKEVFGATYLNLLNVRSVAPNDVCINPDLFLLAKKMKWTEN